MHYPSSSPIEETSFSMLSDLEEAEMDRARSSRFGVQGDDGSDDEHPYHRRHRRPSHPEEERGEGMMDTPHGQRQSGSSGFDSNARLLPERMERERGMGMGKTHFDFEAMEEYAQRERDSQGGAQNVPQWIPNGEGMRQRQRPISAGDLSGEGEPQSYDTTMGRTNTMSAYDDDRENDHSHDHENHEGDVSNEQTFSPKESDSGTTHFHRRRQRKLSQSNPVMRRQGKLALFEGFGSLGGAEGGNDSPAGLKAPRQPKNLGTNPSTNFVPFTDAAPGHDRPYRFSFYSNALPVTIHARTLAELPADGQTFQDLFKGTNADVSPRTGGTESGSFRPESNVNTPGSETYTSKMSMLAKTAGAAGATNAQNALQKGPPGGHPGGEGGDEDPEAFTWWLDVLSPTDEEMRMLSKVCDIGTASESAADRQVFGIHPLTTEDILLEETREKIELFRNYYLVCFRSFDQDPYSQTYLEPLNMYIIVFREGTLSVS